MSGLVILLGLLVILTSAVAALVLAAHGGAVLLRAARTRVRPFRLLVLGGLELLAAAALVAAPVVAHRWAEARTGWVDEDGNGFADPMANGGYDWFDINAATWFRLWVALALAILLPAATAAIWSRRGDPHDPLPARR